MNTILVKAKKIIGKAALATVALGGFLGFFGAGTARMDITDHTATIACIASGMNGITAGGIGRR